MDKGAQRTIHSTRYKGSKLDANIKCVTTEFVDGRLFLSRRFRNYLQFPTPDSYLMLKKYSYLPLFRHMLLRVDKGG